MYVDQGKILSVLSYHYPYYFLEKGSLVESGDRLLHHKGQQFSASTQTVPGNSGIVNICASTPGLLQGFLILNTYDHACPLDHLPSPISSFFSTIHDTRYM